MQTFKDFLAERKDTDFLFDRMRQVLTRMRNSGSQFGHDVGFRITKNFDFKGDGKAFDEFVIIIEEPVIAGAKGVIDSKVSQKELFDTTVKEFKKTKSLHKFDKRKFILTIRV